MNNWKIFKNKTKSLTLAGVGKAKELGEMTKTNLNNLAEEEKIAQTYAEIGKLYVQLHEDAPEEAYVELFARLKQAKQNIQKNKDRAATLKKEGNISDDDIVVYMESEKE